MFVSVKVVLAQEKERHVDFITPLKRATCLTYEGNSSRQFITQHKYPVTCLALVMFDNCIESTLYPLTKHLPALYCLQAICDEPKYRKNMSIQSGHET